MNESSKDPPPKPNATVVAAQAVLARRSNEQIPLSLGKASLRMRLEAYYSLISPDTLSNRTEWLRKYDQIYEKYGGTHQGERKLSAKLAKKYGTAVRLLLVTEASSRKTKDLTAKHADGKRDESWYRLRPEEIGSGVIDFLSSKFDPSAALTRASTSDVSRANPWMEGSSILDNLGKCATLLSNDDPLFREDHRRIQLQKTVGSKQSGNLISAQGAAAKSNSDEQTKKRPNTNPHPFDTIASHLDSGPHSLLFRMKEQRKRVRIVVRYVNMVRGTLTGTLIAFDKHMNMILRDVEEVYSPRLVDEENNKSNLELELERRRRLDSIEKQGNSAEESSSIFDNSGEHLTQQPGAWNVRRRQMKQLMVRGDMVVSIFEAGQENRRVSKSRYVKQETTANSNKRRKSNDGRQLSPTTMSGKL